MFHLEYLPNQVLTTTDAALGELFEEIRSVIAPSGLNVLVVGPSGSGKEGVARSVHFHSDRRGKPFIAVNCAAIAESLAESELFGHEKGAFTGANQARPGYFEAAQGGTVFLDEIGDLPLALQAKLLRVLENGEIVRVGSSRPMTIDVRVVAATNRDPKEMVAQGKFREDLYYRLAAETIQLPGLSERPGDVIFLAQHFAQEEAQKRGNGNHPGKLTLSPEVVHLLASHPWPGNVRELKWLMHSAVARRMVRHLEKSISEIPMEMADLPRHFRSEKRQVIVDSSPRSPRQVNLGSRILELLNTRSPLTIPQLAREIPCSKDAVRRCIARLEKDGKIQVLRQAGPKGVEVRKIGAGPSGGWAERA